MKGLTQLVLKNAKVTLFFMLCIAFLGYKAFETIPRAYDPGFTIRAAQVITQFPGASPQRVEELVTDHLEKAILQMAEIDFVKSQSKNGVSIITVNVKESYQVMRPIWDSLRRKVESAATTLPDGVSQPIVNDEFGDVFGTVIAISGNDFSYRDLKQTAEDIRSGLLLLEDVAKIDIFGIQEEQIKLVYDNQTLTKYGLTPNYIANSLSEHNIVISGGSIKFGNERITLEPTGNFNNIEEITNTQIILPQSNQSIRLGDIVKVVNSYQTPADKPVSFSGDPALSVAIAMKEGGNNIRLGEDVDAYIAQFEQGLPLGLTITKVNDSPAEVKQKVEDFTSSLVQAIVVVAIVMFAFLGWRTGIIVSALIPMSMLITIIFMIEIGVGLDQISLAALIIALGMLVDNGIVMSESILKRLENGMDKVEAAIITANELKLPLLTSSLTTSAAFLPIFLAKSTMGEYTGSLFTVVTITLLASWVLSLTLIPLLCVLLLKVNKQPKAKKINKLVWFDNLLTALINKKWLFIGATFVVLIGSFQGMKLLPSIFFPPAERNFFKMEVIMPTGTSIEYNQEVVADIERYLDTLKADDTGIKNWVAYLGSGGPRYILPHSPRTSSPEYSFWVINTFDYHENPELMAKIENYINNNHPDAVATPRLIENGKSVLNPVEIRISGLDSEKTLAISKDIKQQMAQINGLKNITDNWGEKIKKINIVIDEQKLNRAGLSHQDIALSIQSASVGKKLTSYRDGVLSIPVVLSSKEQTQLDIGKLKALPIYGASKTIPLEQLATIDVQWQNANIYHRNRFKTVTVGAQLEGEYTAVEGVAALTPWLDEQSKSWPNGYFYEIGGEIESSQKSTATIAVNFPLAGFIVLALLLAQFNSFRKPVIILSTIPVAFIGVIWGLVIGNSFFGFMTFLGVISLAGIVINNAIVLLEQVQIEQDKGSDTVDAVIEAAKQRMRPILLTTATTVLGLMPLLISGGSMWQTMAIAIIAGLIFSTLLTLIFIPVLYCALFPNNSKPTELIKP
ncbi:efflux RND transporter permease subunit [Paraferrimonas sp. SM1919]|uniref:efflux RND transporter permease subunit n=1 Tax=Paraferrimonas sp. SM1919 TaxID=2662263 RepID=UPI0013CFC785|nr:efflux RND transporter permease subunit [Paraferrimonas sp. SM1919]